VTFRIFLLGRTWLLAMLASCALGGGVFAAEAAREPAIRAALLFNFMKFTEWPAAATEQVHLQVCIASHDQELIAALETINARQVHGKAVLTAIYGPAKDCDVIYVDSRQRWQSMAEQISTTHALTVAGYTGFVADGGMIEIALQEGGSRFDINLGKAKQAGLRFYPQFLRLARRIVE
jgi:hypothetical protein